MSGFFSGGVLHGGWGGGGLGLGLVGVGFCTVVGRGWGWFGSSAVALRMGGA